MLSAITLGLRALQMVLAMALLGLSISIVAQKVCGIYDSDTCYSVVSVLWEKNQGPKRTLRYGIFLGVYGMVVSAIGTVSLFLDRISTIVPLVGDGLGVLFYLAGGIAWVVHFGSLPYTCNDWESLSDWVGGVSHADQVVGACRRCEAEHGLVWALFAFTASLAICDYFRRRDQARSLT